MRGFRNARLKQVEAVEGVSEMSERAALVCGQVE